MGLNLGSGMFYLNIGIKMNSMRLFECKDRFVVRICRWIDKRRVSIRGVIVWWVGNCI